MSDFDLLSVASAGMQAQRSALDVAARNIAGAEAAGPGGTYEREVPEFKLVRDASGDEEPVDTVVFAGTRRERGSDMDLLTEMIGVMNASRAYEANASVFDLGKRLAERTIDMGRL
jgi:flagellar basal-body rod protein FlgC